MKPGDRTKTVVIDLNVVENPSRFEPIVHRVRREGGYIMLTESHLSELFKDAQTWRVALAKHCAALQAAVDLVVIPRQTHELFASELLEMRPARKLIDLRITRNARHFLRFIQKPEDIDRYANGKADAWLFRNTGADGRARIAFVGTNSSMTSLADLPIRRSGFPGHTDEVFSEPH